jgi:hypothetical protein
MPTNGKLLSDYSTQEWRRFRQSLLKPDLVYWFTIISIAFFLLLSGFGRIPAEGYSLEAIFRIGGGLLLVVLLTAYMIRKINRRTRK